MFSRYWSSGYVPQVLGFWVCSGAGVLRVYPRYWGSGYVSQVLGFWVSTPGAGVLGVYTHPWLRRGNDITSDWIKCFRNGYHSDASLIILLANYSTLSKTNYWLSFPGDLCFNKWLETICCIKKYLSKCQIIEFCALRFYLAYQIIPFPFACICACGVYLCVQAWTCVGVHTCAFAFRGMRLMCLPQSLSTIQVEAGSLLNLELRDSLDSLFLCLVLGF